MNRFIFLIASTLICSGTAQAQSADFATVSLECADFIGKSDSSLQARIDAGVYADTLESQAKAENFKGNLTRLLPELNGIAAACVAFARQIKGGAAFDPERNRYVAARQIDAEKQAALRKEQDRIAVEAEAEAIARQEALEREVNTRVFAACSKLSKTDPVSAFTNALCVQSFKANGLPGR